MIHVASRTLMGIGLALACAFGATAQPAGQSQSTSMQGVSMNRDQPVRIESNTLEVRDKSRQATFSGDVKLVQGETTLKCRVLVVFYEDSAAPSKKNAPAAAGAPPAQKGQQIKRAEARGDVFVTQKDQTASGENGVFDLKSNTVIMTGNVVVTQGPSVTRGDRLVVNLNTGVTTVESSKGGQRVEFMTQPGAKDVKPAPASSAPAPPPAKAAPKGPIRIN